MTESLVILGAGGHGKALVELLRAHGGWHLVGVVDAVPRGPDLLGLPLLGTEAALPGLLAAGVRQAVVAIGANATRLAAAARLREMGFALPVLVHPSAVVASSAELSEGVVVLPRAVLGACVRAGPLAIVNSGAIVEHDSELGEGAHIGPGAVLPGGVRVGARALVGAGAACRPGVRIGAGALVRLGSAVVRDVPGEEVRDVPGEPDGAMPCPPT